MEHSFKISFCGIMTALALVCMFIAPLFPGMVYTFAMISGLCISISAEEVGMKYAFSVYIAASLLALLLIPDKETAVVFITVFGFYPIGKNLIEKNKTHLFTREFFKKLIKFLLINISCIIYFIITIYFLGVPKESFMIGELYLPGVILIAGDFLCMTYDKAIDNLVNLYKIKFRKKIFRKW